jgi:putative membrane protein
MHRFVRSFASVAFALCAGAIAACSSESLPTTFDAGDASLEDGTTLEGGDALAEADGGSEAADDAGDTESSSDVSMVLTDDQIVTVLHVANQGEIQEAQLALMRAIDTQVRNFANMMITDHTAADAALATLFAAADAGPDADAAIDAALSTDGGLPIAPSTVSAMLLQETMLQIQTLMLKTGAPFDLAYMSGQVATHSEVLQLIDNMLLPQATSPALKMALMDARTLVAAHLRLAVQILNGLASAGMPD